MVSFISDHRRKEVIIWHWHGSFMRKILFTSTSRNMTKPQEQTSAQNCKFLMNITKICKKLSRDTSLHATDLSEKSFNIQNSWNVSAMTIWRKLYSRKRRKTVPEFHTNSQSQRSIHNTWLWATFPRKSWSENLSKLSQEVTSSTTSIIIHSKIWLIGLSKNSGLKTTKDMSERLSLRNQCLVDNNLKPLETRTQATWQCELAKEAWTSSKRTTAGVETITVSNKKMVS